MIKDVEEHIKYKFEGKVFADYFFGGLGTFEDRFLQINYYTVKDGVVYEINNGNELTPSGDSVLELITTKEVGLFKDIDSLKVKRTSYYFNVEELEEYLKNNERRK